MEISTYKTAERIVSVSHLILQSGEESATDTLVEFAICANHGAARKLVNRANKPVFVKMKGGPRDGEIVQINPMHN